MTAPKEILELIERFERNLEAYRSGKYKEAEVRQEFLDPMFEALGWDVANRAGYAEAYKDVIYEESIKIGGFTEAPDYCFRIGGARKFFVEAKKPSVDIKGDIHPAYQLRRYAWSAKLPLSILTDFEEFAVYDCRIEPSKTDKASAARTLYLNYTEYAERWEEIASIFSREAVLKGSFDKYVESAKRKRGTAEVDKVFLKTIEAWRDLLARNIALRNPELTQRELNFAVQRTIDRIIFLRICEDRGIEEYGRLMALLNGANVYSRLGQLFQWADERYNSGLFYFRAEKDRYDPPDELTLGLTIDDKVLKEIIENLYYPESPYEFSVLPADILGQVYEQFLGKVIRLTPAHRAVVEDKPEVKKAGGVYYTPTYIVDYIVKETVGKLLEGKKPGPRGGVSRLKILDPACGSGSFLLAAYQYLLDWHRDRYLEDGPEKHRKVLYQGPGGDWRLTIAERKRILLNNMYGVDIDPQAVEVTKLSLLLKVLEGETEETLERQFKLFRKRALPDLGNNIKCGNSLVGPDFYDDQQMELLEDEELYRINAFDWEAEFPDIFKGKNSGFDAVIGNPPYLSFSGRQATPLSEPLRRYLFKNYETGGWATSHSFFIQRSIEKLSARLVSFIVPAQVGHLSGYKDIRQLVVQASQLAEVRYWGEDVFENVVTPVLTFVADLSHRGNSLVYEAAGGGKRTSFHNSTPWRVSSTTGFIRKLMSDCTSLGPLVADPGVHTGNCSRKLVLEAENAPPDAVPVLEGKQISRFHCGSPKKVLRLGYIKKSGEYFTIRSKEKYETAEFVIRQTAPYPIVGPRKHAVYFRNSLLALYPPDGRMDIRYLVGLLNSRLLRYAYTELVTESQQKSFPQVKVQSLRKLPIRRIDLDNPEERASHDSMVELVDRMLALHRQLAETRIPDEKTKLQRQIDAVDRQIDQRVYDLYGLNKKEIEIVEQSIQ